MAQPSHVAFSPDTAKENRALFSTLGDRLIYTRNINVFTIYVTQQYDSTTFEKGLATVCMRRLQGNNVI